MLPLKQAFEVRSALEEYLKATFAFKDRRVHDAFYRFINDPEDGILKGPSVSLKHNPPATPLRLFQFCPILRQQFFDVSCSKEVHVFEYVS